MYDTSGNLHLINDEFEKKLGWTREDIDREGIMNLCYPDSEYRQMVWGFMQKANPNEWRDFELQTKFGYKSPSSWTNVRLPDNTAIGIGIDITERKKNEERLQELMQNLEMERRNLEHKNIALNEVLNQIQQDKAKIEERFVTNIEESVLPMVMRLKDGVPKSARKSLEAIETELGNITSPFLDNLRSRYRKLTNREIEVCRLIKNGLTSKEIADALNISHMTVQKYREIIRRKFGFVNKKINLTTYLRSLADE
jgi:PAS domain S-box-containing protein